MSPALWLVIGLLILANAFYVAAEFGAVGVRRSRVRRLKEDGNVWARQLWKFVQHPTDLYRYVAVSQVGITSSSLVLGAVGQSIAAVALAPYLATLLGIEPRTAASTAAFVGYEKSPGLVRSCLPLRVPIARMNLNGGSASNTSTWSNPVSHT